MGAPPRVRICFHDNCFDGAASAALFTRFYQERIDSSARFSYRGMSHGPGEVFPAGTFDGDENAVVDFRFTQDARLSWWFDHHQSAFESPADQAAFQAGPQFPIVRERNEQDIVTRSAISSTCRRSSTFRATAASTRATTGSAWPATR